MKRRDADYRNKHGELLDDVNRRRSEQGEKPLTLPESIAREEKIKEHLRFRKRMGLSRRFLKLPAGYAAEQGRDAPPAEQASNHYWMSD